MSESNARMVIDKLLLDSKWVLHGHGDAVNVQSEVTNAAGRADYVLYDTADYPLCVIEAKNEHKSPFDGKEQARRYANKLNCRFAILSNGIRHYFWDMKHGEPIAINDMPTQEMLVLRRDNFDPTRQETEDFDIDVDYIARTQDPEFDRHPDYMSERKRDQFLRVNKLRILRYYQLNALKAVQQGVAEGKDRFLLEMATGTGKTLVSCALIKMFLRLYKVKRVLFLVDRIELEAQAQKQFEEVLKNDYRSVVWKENRSDWRSAEIVVSTVQSFIRHNKYKKVFKPDHFDLVISDEAHRSLGRRSRKVFEYFIGFKLGLTATPKDYLKSVDVETLAENHPKQLERRLQLDTYTTFGCERSEPTFRYSLKDGVKDKYLVNPKVYDARTRISTQLLSDQGYLFEGIDEEGNDLEETFTRKDFEKRFFNNNTNKVWCETFFNKALTDPYTGEIGKTLVFCVSQNHAAKITQVLNLYASLKYPRRYNSDFAVQVTSNVDGASTMTTDFSNNTLNGRSRFEADYITSKTRVCVTVGMMTTGYDCTDILNICMMRPIYSPSEFIQMKGRGTRIYDFANSWIIDSDVPENVASMKTRFFLFDFFGNYEFFEKEFDYDEVLKLPARPTLPPDEVEIDPKSDVDQVISSEPDPIENIEEFLISDGGMKIDNNVYRTFKKKVVIDENIRNLVHLRDFDEAEEYLNKRILGQPEDNLTIRRVGRSLGVDRPVTARELLDLVFENVNGLPNRVECLNEEFDKFDGEYDIVDSDIDNARLVFEAYAIDEDFKDIIDTGEFARLNTHSSGKAFKNLPLDLRQQIPAYINTSGIETERLKDARQRN